MNGRGITPVVRIGRQVISTAPRSTTLQREPTDGKWKSIYHKRGEQTTTVLMPTVVKPGTVKEERSVCAKKE